jgi:hypothetical protein
MISELTRIRKRKTGRFSSWDQSPGAIGTCGRSSRDKPLSWRISRSGADHAYLDDAAASLSGMPAEDHL